MLALVQLPDADGFDDAFYHRVDLHYGPLLRARFILDGLGFEKLANDVLDADYEAGLADDRRAVGQPAGAAAHRLDHEITPVRLGVGQQVADFPRQNFDRGKIAEGEIDTGIIVVDGLGNVDHADSPRRRRQRLLKLGEFVGRLQGVVAPDGDQRVDVKRRQGLVYGAQGCHALRVLVVFRRLYPCPGVGPCRSDHDPLGVAGALQAGVIKQHIVPLEAQRSPAIVGHQLGIAVEDAENFRIAAQERDGGGRDHRVGPRRWPAGKQDGDAAKFVLRQ